MVPTTSSRPRAKAPRALDLTATDAAALKSAQLTLLREFDRICTANGLSYFALYGTLLGAIRHDGFIPWDDDLDVGMLRADFDRLCTIIDDELGERFFFQTVRTDPHYGCMFAKLRLDGTRCVDTATVGSDQHDGIFIDVFPLDAKASRPVAHFEQRLMRYVGFRLLYLKAGYRFMQGTSVPARVVQKVAASIARLLPRRFIIALTNRHTHLGGAEPEQYVSLFGAFPYDHDTIDADWIHPLSDHPFEDTTIPVLADADAYLTQLYGNWRQPPPPAEQVGHHDIVELRFREGG